MDDLVRDINDVLGTATQPECHTVLLRDEELQVVQETVQDAALIALDLQTGDELASHILATLLAGAGLELLEIEHLLVEQGLLNFLLAIEIHDGHVVVWVLFGDGSTLVGSRGLPLVFSVLGLMSSPGGYMRHCVLSHHASV